MTFLAEMNNKRDMMLWNIKIDRVILPTHVLCALGPVAETRKRSVENRGYTDLTEKNFLNWGALPPVPPHPPFLI